MGDEADVDVSAAVAEWVGVMKSAANACTVSARSVLIVGVAEPAPPFFRIWRSEAYNFWFVELTIRNGSPKAIPQVSRRMR